MSKREKRKIEKQRRRKAFLKRKEREKQQKLAEAQKRQEDEILKIQEAFTSAGDSAPEKIVIAPADPVELPEDAEIDD